jgi:hypothetical protein
MYSPLLADVEMDPRSTGHILQLLHPKLEAQRRIDHDTGLLEALRELKQVGAELPSKYQKILDDDSKLGTFMKQQAPQIQRLTGKLYI